MKKRPILFSAPMVRAILAGTKTQTRRVVKHSPAPWNPEHTALDMTRCPYGQPGDRIWVRESWRIGAWNEHAGTVALDYLADGHCRAEWLALAGDDDGEIFSRLWQQSTDDAIKVYGQQDRYTWTPGESPCRWRPSIHMPRWASRILLEITGVRVERLQDISEADAKAEGVTLPPSTCNMYDGIWRDGYRDLWESINGHGSWDANPWVWVIEFKRIEPAA